MYWYCKKLRANPEFSYTYDDRQAFYDLYMKDIDAIRKRFPDRLLEIEMIRRLRPHSLVKQIKKIQIENEYNIDFDLDSLVYEMEKQQKI